MFIRILLLILATLSSKSYASPLIEAIYNQTIHEVKNLLNEGESPFDVDSNGMNALHHASKNGFEEIANILGRYNKRLLLAKTYRIHTDDPKLIWEGEDTPLHIAIREQQPGTVRLLLQLGADLESKNANLDTPLSVASRTGNLKIVKILVANGANIKYHSGIEGTFSSFYKERQFRATQITTNIASLGLVNLGVLASAAFVDYHPIEAASKHPEVKRYLRHLLSHPNEINSMLDNKIVQDEATLNKNLSKDRNDFLKKFNEVPLLDLARISKAVYENVSVHSYELVDSIEDLGMRASFYFNHTESVGVLVFRGSVNEADWLGRNLALFLADDPNFDPYGSSYDHSIQTFRKAALVFSKDIEMDDISIKKLATESREIYKKVINDMVKFDKRAHEKAKEIFNGYGARSFLVTGHSLGGLHAQIVARIFGKNGASFNSPGIPITVSNSEYFKSKKNCKFRFVNHRASSDIVSNIAANRTFLTISHKINTDDILESHSIEIMVEHLSLIDHKRDLCCPLKCDGSFYFGTEKTYGECKPCDYPSDDEFEYEDLNILDTDDKELKAAKQEINQERKNSKVRNQRKKAARIRSQLNK